MTSAAFSSESRYSRHLSIPEIGVEGQKKLAASSLLIVGAGGLGSPVALYLAAAGVGRIGLMDDDRVSLSNLQRQVLYATQDVGRSKVDAAREKLAAFNPEIKIETYEDRLSPANALGVIRTYDLVVDATDNFQSRYLTNDTCVRLRKPLIYGAVLRFDGQVSTFLPDRGCYRCLYPHPPEAAFALNREQAGVLGVLPGIIGSLQATEALKVLLGIGEPLAGRLLSVDALTMRFDRFAIPKREDCAACGARSSAHFLASH